MSALRLRPYQQQAVRFLLDKGRANLWAGMGMGKTVSALTVLSTLDALGELTDPVLVLAPKRVAVEVWPAEVEKWQHLQSLRVTPLAGSAEQRLNILRRATPGVYTMTYELLPWLAEAVGDAWPFRTVVADESARLRSFRFGGSNGRRARAVARFAHSRVERWYNLTGTPAPNGLQQLWGQQWFIDRGEALGRTYSCFIQRFFYDESSGYAPHPRLQPAPGAFETITQLLSQTTLRLDPAEWFDLRQPVRATLPARLSKAQEARYRELERQMYLELGDTSVEAFSAAALTNKCLQYAAGAVYTDDGGSYAEVHSHKLDVLEDLLEELDGRPLLVAYLFRFELDRLKKRFPFAVSIDEPGAIERWNRGEVRLLAAHPASAGHGLNLQYGGHHLCFLSCGWDLELHDQMAERIGPVRQLQAGFDRPVHVYYIVTEGTIEELVTQRLASKASVQELLLARMRGDNHA